MILVQSQVSFLFCHLSTLSFLRQLPILADKTSGLKLNKQHYQAHLVSDRAGIRSTVKQLKSLHHTPLPILLSHSCPVPQVSGMPQVNPILQIQISHIQATKSFLTSLLPSASLLTGKAVATPFNEKDSNMMRLKSGSKTEQHQLHICLVKAM